MALISLQEISLAFGGPKIFDGLTLHLEKGERIALLGRNGTGKTTLMKVMAGQLGIDDGKIVFQKGISVTHLPQEIPRDIKGNVFDIVLSGLGRRAELLSEYHHLSHVLHNEPTSGRLRQLDALQAELERTESWEVNRQVEHVLSELKLDPEGDFEKLSGGQKRRVILAKTLVLKPEVLLLDEPTNHLDIDSISWLEGFLKDYVGTLFFVTHDRMFMSHLTTRILELDRGRLLSWACNYQMFLERKLMTQEIETAQRAEFDRKLAAEEIWIRQGVKARRCRNEGRVKALERLRAEKKAQRQMEGQVRIKTQKVDPSGHLVIKASHVGFRYGDKIIIRDFSTQIMRGDKIGIIGPNGCGKTTLLRILLEQLPPHKGKSRLGTNLVVAYFDQLRESLEEEKSVIENICGNADTLTINGKPRHIIGYLQDFLFTPERSRTPVKVLSGGERNRLLLARLFTKPFNLLVMDEPTNDLDMETLELLEELLLEFPGTLLLVSHDRTFLNNVVTSTIVFEGDGEIHEYPGGYDDWLSQRKIKAPGVLLKARTETVVPVAPKPRVARKLSFKEERELERLPAKIEKLEEEQEEICALMADVTFYQKDPHEITRLRTRLDEIADDLLLSYERWENLEESRNPDAGP